MNGAEILTKFTADTSGVDKATNGFTASLGKLTKAFTLGNLAAKGISKAIQVFNQNLDGAIKRTDTLNNFPKVMSNLGIGADEAEKSINTLSKKLEGLPTSLDSAASAVQRFTSGNGDIEKSTKYFLAVNNAILAGGAPMDQQASALEQLSQAYAKGKPDMMEWRTLMSAMPAQLKQVATTMGYVDATALGEALRQGDVSMESFMQTIEKMNTQGVNGFKSFEEQARNSTGGIQTTITNMKTAFTRGIADVITATDDSLAEFGGLAGVITKIGKGGEKAFKEIGKAVKFIIPFITQLVQGVMPQLQNLMSSIVPILLDTANRILPMVVDLINQLVPFMAQIVTTILPPLVSLINEFLPPIMQIISEILPILIETMQPLLGLIQPLIQALKPLLNAIIQIIKPLVQIIGEILPPISKLIAGIVENVLPPLTYAIMITTDTIVDRVNTILGFIKDRIENIKRLFRGVIDFLTGVFTGDWKLAWEGVKDIFKGIVDSLIGIFKVPLNFIIDGINKFIRGLNNIEIPDWVPAVGGKGFDIKEIPKLATGTNYVPEDTLAMLHQGEAVIPKKFNPYANVNPTTIGSMGATNNIIVNITNEMEFDSLGQLVNNIKTFSGGAKNDYNYGMGG